MDHATEADGISAAEFRGRVETVRAALPGAGLAGLLAFGDSPAAHRAGKLGLAGSEYIPASLLGRIKGGFSVSVEASSVLAEIEAIKSEAELRLMRRAAALTDAAMGAIRDTLADGKPHTERELALLADRDAGGRCRPHRLRPDGPGWATLGLQPGRPTDRVLEPGDLVMTDIGARYRGYVADGGRGFTYGPPSAEKRAVVASGCPRRRGGSCGGAAGHGGNGAQCGDPAGTGHVRLRAPGRRGLYGSFPQLGVPLGLLLSTGVFALVSGMPTDQFLAWGWRIPFRLSVALIAIGLFIRLRVMESPVFRAVRDTQTVAKAPLLELLRRHPKDILLAVGTRSPPTSPST